MKSLRKLQRKTPIIYRTFMFTLTEIMMRIVGDAIMESIEVSEIEEAMHSYSLMMERG